MLNSFAYKHCLDSCVVDKMGKVIETVADSIAIEILDGNTIITG